MSHAATHDDAGTDFERVCDIAAVRPGTLLAATLSDGTRACIGHSGNAFFAISDRCPHQKFPLSDGELTPEGTVVCSRHGASYDCTTGRAIRGPLRDTEREGAFGRVAVYEIRISNGGVYVKPPQVNF
jgi:nitrite reductase/ring-hydroxylating ferredoxin subunit